MEKIILDTSVLVKLFSPDEKDIIADSLLSLHTQKKLSLTTIDFGLYELANTLKFSKRAKGAEIYQHLLTLFRMDLEVITFTNNLLEHALILMDQFPITMYDASFVAAAEIEKVSLLTADYKHHTKEISPSILHYQEWK